MKHKFSKAVIVIIGLFLLNSPSHSRPYPDQVGICYAYKADTKVRMEVCIISIGWGAGAHYAVLQWPDKHVTNIWMETNCPDQQRLPDGFCSYFLDDKPAERYRRDVFGSIAPMEDEDPDNMDCYRVTETGNSVCYRIHKINGLTQ